MIQKYRKRPVVVEAMRMPDAYPEDVDPSSDNYAGNRQAHAVMAWVADHLQHFDPLGDEVPDQGWTIDPATGFLNIATLEGVMQVKPGDYVIKDIQGEFYPCKPDIFESSYQLA
jgi:hypothetical protein